MKSKCFRFYRLGNSMIRDNVYEDDRFAGGGGSRWAGRAEVLSGLHYSVSCRRPAGLHATCSAGYSPPSPPRPRYPPQPCKYLTLQ